MDVDIDLPKTFNPLDIFPEWTRATVVKDGVLTAHPCGVHPLNIPKDPLTNLAAIPYQEAQELGFFKIDLLHLSVYDIFEKREEIEELLKIEPNWDLLLVPSVVENLFQLSNHYDLLSQIKPRSIEEVADAIALIRPGKKAFLPLYLNNKEAARKILYAKTKDAFSFKKSHAIAYALVIVLQLHINS